MRNNILLAMLTLLAVGPLASCNGNKFKIEGELENAGGIAVRVVFHGDSGVVNEWADVDKKGNFEFQGESAQPTLVSVLNQNNEPLITLVAVNGDCLKIFGDASIAMGVKAKGNRLNEDWQLFRDEHAAFYADPNPSRLDAAIEKYVKENPADMLSTVLLMADYSTYADRDKVKKLLDGIDPKVRPETLTEAFLGNPMGSKNHSVPRLMTLTLCRHGGEWDEITLTGQVTLLNLWANPQTDRENTITSLEALAGATGGDVKIIDVLTESDSIRWSKTIAGDPTTWRHYWAPSGPMEQGLQLLGISILPWYAVTDASGLVVYNGSSLDKAIAAARQQSGK